MFFEFINSVKSVRVNIKNKSVVNSVSKYLGTKDIHTLHRLLTVIETDVGLLPISSCPLVNPLN